MKLNLESEYLPGFIRRGAFNWMAQGYHYDLDSEEALKIKQGNDKSNPWYLIAHVVELAKQGDFSKTGILARYFDTNLIINVAPVALLITGDIGQAKDLDGLEKVMKNGPDGFRVYACKAAANAGCLRLIPHMLEAWHLSEGIDAHENIGYAIADLLDPINDLSDMGPIASHVGVFTPVSGRYPPNSKIEQIARRAEDKDASGMFHTLVMKRYSDLEKIYEKDQTGLWAGRARTVLEFAEFFLEMITSRDFNATLAPLVVPLRHKFEAATGINCSSFFENGRFRQLAAVAVLEKFLSSLESKSFKQHGRHFFGHPILS